jgi:hypothetical protein
MASIWLYAFLYFLFYIPFIALSKSISSGIWPGMTERMDGAVLLPVATAASVFTMVAFLVVSGWWRHAGRVSVLGFSLPVPTRWTLASGICTSAILTTTTLAYTFEGVSIVFIMLLMRGGVLIMAPLVDLVSRRKTRLPSWIGLGLSLGAVVVAFAEEGGTELTLVAAFNVALYLASYFIRLHFMSRLAKTDDPDRTRRYFAEEQLVVAPFTLLALGGFAVIGQGPFMLAVREGFLSWPFEGLLLPTIAVGAFSQLIGIFGTLVFLDKSENTFSVPVNRCSSILAGLAASLVLSLGFGLAAPSGHELVGAALVIVAILVLSLAPLMNRARSAA